MVTSGTGTLLRPASEIHRANSLAVADSSQPERRACPISNKLSSLPDGAFSGLTALAHLELDGNAVDPLPVAVSLEPAGRGRFKAVAPTAAPFALTLPISVVNGEIDGGATTLTIPAGMVQSDLVSVTRSAGSTSAVTADIGTLPELPSNHRGYALEKSSGLPLEVFPAESGAPTPVCDRTEQVRDGIVDQVSEVSTCGGVTDAHLAAITSLYFGNAGITSLQEGDFSGLTALQELDLYANKLSSLPDGVLSGLTALQELYLYANDLSSLPDGAFSGLTALVHLELDGNAVDPLPVAVSLEPAGSGRFKAVAPTAAPFALTLPVSVVNGEIDGGATTLTIPAGMVHSDPVSVTRSAGSTSAVTADIGTLPELPSNHRGYALEKSSDLPLEVFAEVPPTPTVTLVLSADSIGEDGGVSTVTATVSPAVAADFRLSANTVLRFAENATESTGSVTITGVDDDVDAADKTVTVSGTVSATSVPAPATRTLTLEDDDAAGVRVSETALTVTEQDATGDSYTVVLDTEPTHEVTVTIGGHAGTDVSLSASTLTFTPSNWDRAQTVTVKALNDDDTANDAVTLTHTATSTDGNYSGIAIAGVSVTVTDNDTTTPAVTLVLSAGSISENGGVSMVTATVSPAVAADFRLSANTVLRFAENATESTGSVTITGVDDDVDAADKTVTVSGTVSATSVTAPANRTLTLEDDDDATNAPPSFISLAEFEVEENVRTVDTVAASDDDMDDDITGYALSDGADQALFSIVSTSGVLTFLTAPNYEDPQDADTDNAYLVEVQATSGTGDREQMATQTITVTVMDANEQPDTPATPTVTATSGTTDSLDVTWTEPGLNGGPAIIGYGVQYRVVPSVTWVDWTHTGPATTTTITGLTANTEHQVRVLALNGETPSAWSDPSDVVSPNAETPTAPMITDVAVTSTPRAASDTYGEGERIEITVTFNEAVTATTDTDFVLSVAGRKRAPLLRDSGTETLVFGYTVQAVDSDTDGIWIGDQTRTLVGNRNGDPQNGAITSVATGVAADLTHAALGTLDDHKVDGSRTTVEPVEPVEAGDRLQEINCALDRLDGESDTRCNGIDGMPGSDRDLVALQLEVIGQLPPGKYDYYDLAG